MKKLNIKDFSKRQKNMLKVDLRRMFVSPLAYIMFGISLLLPVLILVMTSFMGGTTTVDPNTGATTTIEGFTSVWQIIGSTGESNASMSLTSMCNINLIFFMIAIFVCIFVSEDFKSGYAKNLFTVHAKRAIYVISKTIVCLIVSIGMLLLFFVGAMIGGAIAGLPFTMEGFDVGGLICSMLAKIFVALIFVSIALTLAVAGKQRLWISILGSLAAGMLLFMMIPMMTPLNSSFINVVLCMVGGALFAVGLGAVSNLILNKTSLV